VTGSRRAGSAGTAARGGAGSARPRRGRQRGVRRRAVRGPRSVVGLRGEL